MKISMTNTKKSAEGLSTFKKATGFLRDSAKYAAWLKAEGRGDSVRSELRAKLFAPAYALASSLGLPLDGVPNPASIDLGDSANAPYIDLYSNQIVPFAQNAALEQASKALASDLESIVGAIPEKNLDRLFGDKELVGLSSKDHAQWYAGYESISKAVGKAKDLAERASEGAITKEERALLLAPLVEDRIKKVQDKLSKKDFSLELKNAAASLVKAAVALGNYDAETFGKYAKQFKKQHDEALQAYMKETEMTPHQYVRDVLLESGSSEDTMRFNKVRDLIAGAL